MMMNHKAIENYLRYTYDFTRQNASFNYDMLVERIYIVLFENQNFIPIVRTRTPGATSGWLNQLNENQQDNLLDRNVHGLLLHTLPNRRRGTSEVEPHLINLNSEEEKDDDNHSSTMNSDSDEEDDNQSTPMYEWLVEMEVEQEKVKPTDDDMYAEMEIDKNLLEEDSKEKDMNEKVQPTAPEKNSGN